MAVPAQVVLLVEDDINDRMLLRHAFRKAASHLDLRMAKDAFQAEEYLVGRGSFADRAGNPLPSLILIDLKMPRKSGLEFLGWLKGQAPLASIPVIVLSSSQEASDVDRAYELGAKSYLVKSVDLNELIRVVQGIGAMASLLRCKS
jgi:CheY-like chemotaxis protein